MTEFDSSGTWDSNHLVGGQERAELMVKNSRPEGVESDQSQLIHSLRLQVQQNARQIKSMEELRKLDSAAMEAMCQGIDERFQRTETGLVLVMAGLEKLRLDVAKKEPRKRRIN